MPPKYLKKANIPMLVVFLIWNVAIFLVASNGGMATFWTGVRAHIAELKARDSLFVFLSPLILAIASGLLPSSWKDTLVFWRIKDTLPGCRAFSELVKRDPRIDELFIAKQFPTGHGSPREQNTVWYKWYKEVQNQETVRESHKQFLLNRDLTGIAYLFSVFGSWALFLFGSSASNVITYTVITVLQFLIFSLIARNHGNRFVCNVIVEYQHKNDH